MKLKILSVAGLFVTLAAGPAVAASCGNTGVGFDRWLAGFKKAAAAKGWRRGGGFKQAALTDWNKSRKNQVAIAVFAERVK
ncbi:MAG: variable surface lipoprotein [Anderseniella sp.]